jgi:hypothetical protein
VPKTYLLTKNIWPLWIKLQRVLVYGASMKRRSKKLNKTTAKNYSKKSKAELIKTGRVLSTVKKIENTHQKN